MRATQRWPTPSTESDEEDFLDSDSEEDEFANEAGPSSRRSQSTGSEEAGNVQWEPDDWKIDDHMGSSGAEDDGGESRLETDLKSIPLATLARAQKQLSKSQVEVTVPDRLAEVRARLAEMQRLKGKGKAIPAMEAPSSEDAESEGDHRGKHAPAVMSSKKQVSRHRQAIPVAKSTHRDPRFLSVAGEFNSKLHSQSYSFLPDMLQGELDTLRTQLAAAQKAEKTCAWKDKAAKVAEREELAAQVGRLRTRVDRAKREQREREALANIKKVEKQKQAEGKGAWYMKKAEQRDLLLKSRFEYLQAEGGKNAVKKAVEKKRKKIAAKEKKSRPNEKRRRVDA